MVKKIYRFLLLVFVVGMLGCGNTEEDALGNGKQENVSEGHEQKEFVSIELSDQCIFVDGKEISKNKKDAVYRANDIIFYLEGQGFTYGEGTDVDEHSQEEADAHTVVHITKPGTYEISGKMEAGQIFIDLGKDAEDDPEAVVNLVLNNVDISCSVAPAIFFYQVYECGEKDEENASMDVDLTSAGANLLLADGSTNVVNGSYVAKIYKSYELNADETEVIDSKKLHKYDAAVYSKMSMNVFGETGILKINAENEGLDTELHLKIHGGEIQIESGNDGINVNEENVSVFEMTGGVLDINVNGSTGEGDGIDSNGWIIITDGIVTTASCATSMDAGIDADNGIYIIGGTVVASGNMNAEISAGTQKTISFSGKNRLEGNQTYQVKDAEGNVIMEVAPKNAFHRLVLSTDKITEEKVYSLWMGEIMISETAYGMKDGHGFVKGMEPPKDFSKGMEPPKDFPEEIEPPEGFHGGERPERPDGAQRPSDSRKQR